MIEPDTLFGKTVETMTLWHYGDTASKYYSF